MTFNRRTVALKVLRPELAAVFGAERFLKEIETTAYLQHPHILPRHDSGEVDGTAFYVPMRCASRARSRVRSTTRIARA
jgi:serine/threonine protein kinase